MDNYKIKQLNIPDLRDAMKLVWEVFLEFEAPEYSTEGIREFRNFIELPAIIKMQSESNLFIWGCFDKEKIIGVIATRPPCHVALLFVDKEYHRQGVARALYDVALSFYKASSEHSVMTVNSSPYAVKAYQRLGFRATDVERLSNGLRFIPMKHTFR